MSIDWSKAPEGATHYTSDEGYADWWRQDEQCMHEWKGGTWNKRLLWPKSLIPRPTKQSQEWDGESTPAPGDQAKTSGGICSVLAWDAQRNKVAIQWHDGELGVVSAEALKPIRTKEQREREGLIKVIKDCDDIACSSDDIADAILAKYELKERTNDN